MGAGSVEMGVNGRAIREKIKKPSDLFVRLDCVALQEGQHLYSNVRT